MKIAKESWIILAIGLADLITTIIFIRHHGAEEANPIFRRYWEMGLVVFIAARFALLIGPLSVLEWARKRNPVFVSWALRSAIVAYLGMYGIGVVRLNSPEARADEFVQSSLPESSPQWTAVLQHARAHAHGTYFGTLPPIVTARNPLLPGLPAMSTKTGVKSLTLSDVELPPASPENPPTY